MIIYILFLAIFSLDYLGGTLGLLPRIFTWLPEILSGLVAIQVVFMIIRRRAIDLSVKYILLFSVLLVLIMSSVIANGVQPGAVFASIRGYLKYLPFFFLPLVISISDEKLRKQINFLFILILMQVPISILQRFFIHSGLKTGDIVMGTVGNSSVLTIVCLSSIAILIAFYFNRLISLKKLILLVVLCLIPPSINETTVTIFMLPIAFLIPFFLYMRHAENKAGLVLMLSVGMFAMVGFGVVYDQLYGHRWGGSILNIVTDPDQLSGFLSKDDLSEKSDGRIEGDVGRFDSILLAWNYIYKYPTKLLMGVGMGNALESFSDKLIGEYNLIYRIKGGQNTSLSHLLWEFGVLGTLLIFMLFFYILRDTYVLINSNNRLYSALSLGWAAVVVLVAGGIG